MNRKVLRPKRGFGSWSVTAIAACVITIALYPIAIHPMINPDKYKKVQSVTRANIDQEKVQPGNMKVWTDPFNRRKDEN